MPRVEFHSTSNSKRAAGKFLRKIVLRCQSDNIDIDVNPSTDEKLSTQVIFKI